MKALLSTLLLLQLCSTAAASAVEGTPRCSQFDQQAASSLAIHHIGKYHRHGYKFRMEKLTGTHVEQVNSGCSIELQLQLQETDCITFNPRDVQECSLRSMEDRAVVANCSVLMLARDNYATVTRYDCDTRQELTNIEMSMMCPDCPILNPLNDPEGMKSIHEALTIFNKNVSNQRIFALHEVGRIKTAYIPSIGINYYCEFLLVETPCPSLSRIAPESCRPLCPDRARYAFCSSTYSRSKGLRLPLECEFYPAKNTVALGPGEQEPICVSPSPHGPHGLPPQGPPSQAPPPQRPPPQAPPPFVHGPPPKGPPPQAPPPFAYGPPPKGPPPQAPPPFAYGPPPQAPPPFFHGLPPQGPPSQAPPPQRPPPQAPPPFVHGPPPKGPPPQAPPPFVHGPPPKGPPPQAPPPFAYGPPPQAPPPFVHGPPHQGPPPQAPPPFAYGPPPQALPPFVQGPPPQRPPSYRPPHHTHRPPPTQEKQEPPPLFPHPLPYHCKGALTVADPAIHPICPWPLPALPHPRGG